MADTTTKTPTKEDVLALGLAGGIPDDSRAGQYVSYFTEAGWQRWNKAAAVVAQELKDKRLEYKEASDIYQKEIAAIQKRRGDLQKRISDIEVKKAAAQIKREDAEWKEKNTRLREEYKAKTKEARDDAYVASTSYSHGWSKSYGTGAGSSVRAAGGRDALDEALDEVGADGGLTAKQAISGSTGLANDIKSAAAQLRDIKARQASGQLDNTQYGAGVTLYGAHRYMVSKLAQQTGLSEDQVRTALNAELNDAAIKADIDYGAKAILDRAQVGTGGGSRVSESQRQSGAKGGYYGDYELPPMPPLTKEDVNLKPLDDAEAAIKSELKALEGQVPKKPVLEPMDLITATRNEYMQKYGDAPRGTSLQMGGETIAKYENLMPYELTNALGKVKTFFGNYIQSELAAAKAALPEGTELTSDQFNAAVESGKRKAREVLFGGLAQRDPQYAASVASPTAVAGGTATTSTSAVPTSGEGWSSVGVTKPSTGNAVADEAAYQKAKEAWVKANAEAPVEYGFKEAAAKTPLQKDYEYFRRKGIEADTAAARGAGLLPMAEVAMSDINAPVDLSGVKLQAPPKTQSEYEAFFKNRLPPVSVAETTSPDLAAMLEAQRQRIATEDLRKRSMEGERRAPAFEVKPEGPISAIPMPQPEANRTAVDYLLRGFKPELDRVTGKLIIPPMTPQQKQDAIVGMTSGSQQANLFPESMSPTAPRLTSEGVAARPLSVGELKPSINKLDRAALGIPDTVGTPVGSEVLGGDMGAMQRKKEQLKKAMEDLKKKRELPQEQQDFLNEAGKSTGATLEQRDTKAKTEAVLAGTQLATEAPKEAGKLVTKDAMGKYIATVYDENKGKGARARGLGDLTQTIIREYAGDAEKQKRAVEILSSLAALDSTSGKINA